VPKKGNEGRKVNRRRRVKITIKVKQKKEGEKKKNAFAKKGAGIKFFEFKVFTSGGATKYGTTR